ncbi:MAG: phage terminase large subunit [Deltaproteobacteria bacterium]|nr:phage terminase large subunit [Deltaproteobacteria bacterium]
MHTKTDSFRNLYVSDYIRAHLEMGNFLNALFDMAAHVQGLTAVGVEILPSETEQNSAIIHVIREEMRKREQFFTLTAIKPHRDKVTRTQSLQALYSNGMVFIRKEHVELEDELLRFPKGEHDDLVDALAYAAGIMQEPKRKPVLQPEPSEPLIGY